MSKQAGIEFLSVSRRALKSTPYMASDIVRALESVDHKLRNSLLNVFGAFGALANI